MNIFMLDFLVSSCIYRIVNLSLTVQQVKERDELRKEKEQALQLTNTKLS
jgi:hypothetical protein